jgi:hypothetical protein
MHVKNLHSKYAYLKHEFKLDDFVFLFEIKILPIKIWFCNRRAKYRREDEVKGRGQHQQLINDMGENMRPSGTTPPPPPQSAVYHQGIQTNLSSGK